MLDLTRGRFFVTDTEAASIKAPGDVNCSLMFLYGVAHHFADEDHGVRYKRKWGRSRFSIDRPLSPAKPRVRRVIIH